MPEISFTAPPTCARFMRSEAFFRLIAGPVGSGKTFTSIMELLRRSIEQRPAPDGIRYTRFAIVRQTLKQLEDTVLKDIEAILKGLCQYKISHRTIHVKFGDVQSEWLLIPLEDQEDQRRLLSSQLTGAWMSESIEMDTGVIAPLAGRCGRFPSPAQGGASWFGIIADTNFPTEGSDWHKLMEVETPPDWQVFKQPGGLARDTAGNPIAENLNFLTQTPDTLALPIDHPDRVAQGLTYYQRLANNNPEAWVRRYVHAEYGPDPSGSAVFRTTFTREFHTVDGIENELMPSHGWPLIVAQDFGRNPCALICQVDHKGRLLVLEEVVSQDMGLELHIKQHLRPTLMQERYTSLSNYIIGDPAGRARNTTFEETSFDTLKRHGFSAYWAPTNDIDKRLRAVEALLLQQRDGGAALLIDRSRCPKLCQALGGQYRFAKKRSGQLNVVPEKLHPWSDLADCLQYAALVAGGGMSEYLATRIISRSAPPRGPRISARAWT